MATNVEHISQDRPRIVRNQANENAGRDDQTSSNEIKVGKKDPNGITCDRIWWSTERYTVYEVEGGCIRHLINERYENAKAFRKRYFKISAAHLRVEYLRKEYGGDKRRKYFLRVNRVIARSVAQALDGHPHEALKLLEELRSQMEARVASRRRMKYVKTNGFVCVVIVSALIALSWLICEPDSLRILGWNPSNPRTGIDWFPFDRSVFELYLKLFILGALGAFLSVSVGIKKTQIPDETTTGENIWTGGARILIGVLGAMFMGLTLDAGLFLANTSPAAKEPTYYLFAFLAGFSETLVPNALRSTEQSAGASGTA